MPNSLAEHLWGLLLIVLLALLLLLVRDSLGQPALATYYVSQRGGYGLSAGNDSHSCEQARNTATPRATLNRGIACMKGGDTLRIGPGTYDELLTSQTSSSMNCNSSDAAAQPGCAPIPNGLSPAQKTILLAQGTETVLSPVGRKWPGGGMAINMMDYARYIHVEGLRIVRHTAAGSTGGFYNGNSQYITIKHNTLDDGQIKGGVTSRYLEVLGNHIFGTGMKDCPQGVKPTPSQCAHGMYICGTDHVITDNVVQGTSYYGIQVSCEQGGIARIRLERNRVENSPVVGIRCAGSECFVGANVLVSNGTGITVSGSGTITHNTIHEYNHASWLEDPAGIWVTSGDGSGFTMTNNLITNMRSAFLTIGNAQNAAPNPAKAHHNMGDLAGNAGVTLIAPASAIYTGASAGDFSLRAGSPAIGAGVSQDPTPTDIRGAAYPTPPDLGAYAATAGPVEPPIEPPIEPPVEPPPAQAMACTGELGAKGAITLQCTPQAGARR